MKKLLLALGITTLMSLSTTAAFAGCGCPVKCDPCEKPKTECGCPTKCDPCEEKKCPDKCDKCGKAKCDCDCPEKCETCGDMAKSCFGLDCFDQKREELYCRLNLDSCQKKEADCIVNEHRSDYDCTKEQLKTDHNCLCEKIQASCLDRKAVREQARVVKKDIREVKKVLKCMDKDFKKILKCDQNKEYRKFKSELKFRMKHGQKYCCKPCNVE